jgi:hypothetical protein
VVTIRAFDDDDVIVVLAVEVVRGMVSFLLLLIARGVVVDVVVPLGPTNEDEEITFGDDFLGSRVEIPIGRRDILRGSD